MKRVRGEGGRFNSNLSRCEDDSSQGLALGTTALQDDGALGGLVFQVKEEHMPTDATDTQMQLPRSEVRVALESTPKSDGYTGQ